MGKRIKIIEYLIGSLFVLIFCVIIKTHYLPNTNFNFLEGVKMEFESVLYQAEFITYKDFGKPILSSPNSASVSIPVLVYHGVLNESSNEDISVQEFKAQMFALKKAGYQTITIDEYLDYVGGKREIVGKPFLLTFDDGRKASYYPVDPILKALQYNAIMYVITGHYTSGKMSSYYLDKEELAKMVRSGRWSLQSHGRFDHNPITINQNAEKGRFIPNKEYLASLSRYETNDEYYQRIKEDLIGSKDDIEKDFGTQVVSYAFPFGDYGTNALTSENSENILNIAKSVYPIAFSQFRPEAKSGYYRYNIFSSSTDFLQRRVKILPNYSAKDLLAILSAGAGKELPYIEDFKSNQNWIYGSDPRGASIGSDGMTISALPDTTVAFAFLDGTEQLHDYEYSLVEQLEAGKSIELIARASNGDNYLSCLFENNKLQIRQVVDGEESILSDTQNKFQIDIYKPRTIGVWVKGSKIGCTANDVTVSFAGNVNATLDQGSIGIKIWEPEAGTAKLKIKKFSIIGI